MCAGEGSNPSHSAIPAVSAAIEKPQGIPCGFLFEVKFMDNLQLNTGLIEAFGELEQLCNQIYGTRHGVTDYINKMKSCGTRGSYYVKNWDKYLSVLIALRHKRNKLSHGEISFQSNWASEKNIQFARLFREMILRQEDPLAQYSRLAHPRPAAQSYVASPQYQTRKSSSVPRTGKRLPPRTRTGCAVAVLYTALLTALLIFLLICLL